MASGCVRLRSADNFIHVTTVYTLADLENWQRAGRSFAVLGHPIKHSISPQMHMAALAVMRTEEARFADWEYVRFDVPPEMLPQALALLHEKNFHGLNLTVPHKVLALTQLASIDPAARLAGAVNTLKRTPSGWHGYNRDGYGITAGVREDFGYEVAGKPVILLGAGGAARGAAVACLQAGCASLWIGNRTPENLATLLSDLQPLVGAGALHGFDTKQLPAELPAGALVVNATSAGLRPTDAPPIELARLSRPIGVYDMIYNPPETRLLAEARALGLPAANGLSMLIHQGARALEIWSERSVPVAAMRQAVTAALSAA